MIELIELIIRLFVGIQRRRSPAQSMRRITPSATAPVRFEPPNRAVVRNKIPSAKRAPGRRSTPPPIAIAQPIMTGGGAVQQRVATASTGTAHAVPAMSIAATAAATAAAAPNAKPSASATTLRKWMTPSTLRQQFMLTEIFQPPLALRDALKHL